MHTAGTIPLAEQVEQRRHDRNLSVLRGVCLPSDRKPGHGVDRGVNLVAVEPSALAGADRGPVIPACVGGGVPLPFRPAVVEMPLTVGVPGRSEPSTATCSPNPSNSAVSEAMTAAMQASSFALC